MEEQEKYTQKKTVMMKLDTVYDFWVDYVKEIIKWQQYTGYGCQEKRLWICTFGEYCDAIRMDHRVE